MEVDGGASILDLSGNELVQASSLVSNRVASLTSVAVGAVTPAGSVVTCAPGAFTVTAGGVDLGSTADILPMAYRTMTGDFEARARVTSLSGTGPS